MPVRTAGFIIDQASFILKDDDNVRWTRSQLLSYVNEAQVQICQLLPDTCRVRTVINLSEGVSQTLPDDCQVLFTISCNVDEEGRRGAPVRLSTRSLFDTMMENWYGRKQKREVETYIVDARDGRGFDVFPPNDGTGRVEAEFSTLPKDCQEADVLSIGPEFALAVLYFVLYRAALLDSDYNGTGVLSQFYYQQFSQAVTAKDTNENRLNALSSMVATPTATNGSTE